jgi:hypothetical protein
MAVELDKSLSEEEYEMVAECQPEIDPLIVRLTEQAIQGNFLAVVEVAADLAVIFFAIGREAGKQEANASR